MWQRKRHATWGELRTAIFSHWKLMLYLMVFMMAMNLAAHGTQDMYPTFLLRQRGFTVSQRSLATAISMIGAIVGGTLFRITLRPVRQAALDDRRVERRDCGDSAVGVSVPMAWVVFGAFVMQFMVQGAWGVVPAHLTELSPDSVRGFLPGFGYQMGVLAGKPGKLCRGRRGPAYRLCGRDVSNGGGVLRHGNHSGGAWKGTPRSALRRMMD